MIGSIRNMKHCWKSTERPQKSETTSPLNSSEFSTTACPDRIGQSVQVPNVFCSGWLKAAHLYTLCYAAFLTCNTPFSPGLLGSGLKGKSLQGIPFCLRHFRRQTRCLEICIYHGIHTPPACVGAFSSSSISVSFCCCRGDSWWS